MLGREYCEQVCPYYKEWQSSGLADEAVVVCTRIAAESLHVASDEFRQQVSPPLWRERLANLLPFDTIHKNASEKRAAAKGRLAMALAGVYYSRAIICADTMRRSAVRTAREAMALGEGEDLILEVESLREELGSALSEQNIAEEVASPSPPAGPGLTRRTGVLT